MIRYVIVKNGATDKSAWQVLRIKTDLDQEDLAAAMKSAAADFVREGGREAEAALSACGNKLRWKDAALWLPDEFTAPRGFVITDATQDIQYAEGDDVLTDDPFGK